MFGCSQENYSGVKKFELFAIFALARGMRSAFKLLFHNEMVGKVALLKYERLFLRDCSPG